MFSLELHLVAIRRTISSFKGLITALDTEEEVSDKRVIILRMNVLSAPGDLAKKQVTRLLLLCHELLDFAIQFDY